MKETKFLTVNYFENIFDESRAQIRRFVTDIPRCGKYFRTLAIPVHFSLQHSLSFMVYNTIELESTTLREFIKLLGN